VKEIPYAIGNEELDDALAVNEGDIVSIVVDGVDYQSPVVFGWKIVDGQKIPSDLIGAINLPDDRIILVAVSGKLLPGVTLIGRKK
jgi:hypothetical protein